MGVTYLLDTHTLIWLLGAPHRVGADVRDELARGENRLLVSAVSAMEVATKVRLGKLDEAKFLVSTWEQRIADLRAEELSVSPPHALLAGSMDWDHRDPFDRMLAAQALVENVPLVTADSVFSGLPGLRTRW
ncbi:type II toxin-antitoxin system VapC family toxin [Antribacter sp. KLBMP9083]|uniref:Type II toxin-antitoxin system VapC family toxin n=1 Tax=Antribacter soli TaxID=2910976 RepID=A0AA41U7G9_9MICO|nr:type II toxin-antitoxin system VapC family toxin [Antribacter soli]MCF4121561.1 type II toxin-antitoxin system VapC family toxin [Antribacter soli]